MPILFGRGTNPDVDYDASGNFVVTWNAYAATPWCSRCRSVFARKYEHHGSAVSEPLLVNQSPGDAERAWLPRVGVASQGHFIVTWTSDAPGTTEKPFARAYTADAAAQGDAFIAAQSNSAQGFGDAAALADGSFVLVWHYNRGFHAQPDSGELVLSNFGVNPYPSLGVAEDGAFLVSWSNHNERDARVLANYRDAVDGGTPSEFIVAAAASRSDHSPAVAPLAGGGFVAVWVDGDTIDFNAPRSLFARTYGTTGEADGPQFRIETRGDATYPKDHNTPAFAASQVGPFDQWPTGMGFEYFFGFVGGDANQWQPNLFRNTTQIYPFKDKPGWNLVTGMADVAIDYIHRIHQTLPSKPFFIKYAPGATHAPHHPTKEWVDKIRKMHLFDEGWNKLRERIFENQKRLGVIPADTQLEPWPTEVIKNWVDCTPEEKKLYLRQVEVFAAYAAYSDHEIGRVVEAIEDIGELDNTLVIYINGDNGTSAEGGPLGTPNEVAFFNGVSVSPEDQMKWYDVWGTEQTYNHMSAGWSWAFDTPFTWFKQNASKLGGIRQNMAVSWPARIKDKGGLREQFMHVIDVVPTILEVSGIPAPKEVDGIKQAPMEGTSFAYTFDAKNARVPSRHKTQYFEMMGQWALYHEGWLLSTKVDRAPWEAFGKSNADPLNNQVLELYDLEADFSQSQDLADKYPKKVKELKKLFIKEAKKYQVFPMDASVAARIAAPRPNITAGRSRFVHIYPMVGLPQGDSPSILNTSYTITAEIEVPKGGAEGMILTSGGRFAGYGFYLLKSKPVFVWNLLDLERIKWAGRDKLAPGKHTLEFDFRYDGLGAGTLAYNNMSGVGRPGTGTLKVDGKAVATHEMPHTLPMILQWDESFDIGSDTLTGVNDADYLPPFVLTAKLDTLTLEVDRPQLTPEDVKKLEAATRNNKMSG